MILSTATTLPVGDTTLEWDSAQWDSESYWDATNPSRLTVPDTEDVYQIDARLLVLVPLAEAGKYFLFYVVDSNGRNVASVSGIAPPPDPPATAGNLAAALSFQVQPLSDASGSSVPTWYEVHFFSQGTIDWTADNLSGYLSRFGITKLIGVRKSSDFLASGLEAETEEFLTTEAGSVLIADHAS